MAPIRTTEQRSMFGARNMIMWEEQLVDPPIEPLIKKLSIVWVP